MPAQHRAPSTRWGTVLWTDRPIRGKDYGEARVAGTGGDTAWARKLGPGADPGPAPQWSTGTGTGWSHRAGCPTTCPTCQRSSAHATPPRATGSGTWNPTARPSASGPPLCTRPPSDKDRPSAGTPRLSLGCCPHPGPRALGGQVKGVSSKSPGRQLRPVLAVGSSLFTVSAILGAGGGAGLGSPDQAPEQLSDDAVPEWRPQLGSRTYTPHLMQHGTPSHPLGWGTPKLWTPGYQRA